MKRLYSNVGSPQRTLEERPEVLHSVDVNLAAHIALGLVNHVMHETPLHPVIVGNRVIGVDLRSVLHVLENLALQYLSRDVRDDRSANLAKIAVKDALHNRFTCSASCISFFAGKTLAT